MSSTRQCFLAFANTESCLSASTRLCAGMSSTLEAVSMRSHVKPFFWESSLDVDMLTVPKRKVVNQYQGQVTKALAVNALIVARAGIYMSHQSTLHSSPFHSTLPHVPQILHAQATWWMDLGLFGTSGEVQTSLLHPPLYLGN